MFRPWSSFFICLYLYLQGIIAANIPPSPVTHMWQTVAREIYEKSLEQWARSPLDEKGEWAEWLFATQDQVVNDPLPDPLIPDIEITPYMGEATDFYVNEDINSFGLDQLYHIPTPVHQPIQQHIPILPSQPLSRSHSSSSRPTRTHREIPPKRVSKSSDPNRKHVCYLCGHRFDREMHMERHIRSVHTKEKPFVCKVCGWGFTRRDNFQVHVREIHPGGG